MPDDERLGGTPDPHEYGRRHRREDAPPGEEKPRRRRRSMEAGGGLSVADLVQKHSASRSDLTPVDPQHLQQNTLMSGRRARKDRQPGDDPAEPLRRQAPPPPSISDALGGDDFPRADAPLPTHRRDTFPPDDAPRRARREPSGDGFPEGAAAATRRRSPRPHPGEAARNGRRAGEASAHQAVPGDLIFPADGGRPAESAGDAFFPGTPAPGRRGETSGHHAFPPDAPGEGSGPRRRVGEGSAFFPNTPADGGRRGDPGTPAFPGEAAHHAIPGTPAYPGEPARHPDEPAFPGGVGRNGHPGEPAFPGDAGRNGRRPGDPGFPGPAPRGTRRDAAFPADAPHPGDAYAGDPNFPGDPGYPGEAGRNGRRTADSGDPAFPGDPGFPGEGRNGRRTGEASAHHPIPGRNGRRAGEASAHHAVPGDPNFPGDPGFPGEPPRNARRVGETSAHHGIPGDPNFPGDQGEDPGEAPRRRGRGRRAPEAPVPHPNDPSFPRDRDRVGEASAHHPIPGAFPRDDARRQGPPTPPPGQWPGNDSEPRLTPAAIDAPDSRPKTTGVPPVPPPLPPRGDDDLVSMTTEMEAIGEEVQKRRSIDHTLARFSAVHDEIKAEEREKKAKRRKLMPWQNDDSEMDRLDEMEEQQSMAMRIPVIPPEDEEPEEEPKRGRKKKLRKKLRGRTGKAFVVFFAALVFVSTAAAWSFKSYVDAATPDVDALDPDSAAIQDADAQLGDENFLLVGSDTRSGAAAEEGVGDESEVQGARSDTVMIAHIPENRQRVVVVSFPRDLEVTRPACEGWDPKSGELNGQQHPAEEQVKLNTAYQVGGPKCVTKMVQELSGLAINHFVGIDFHGFKDMVDAVQGVEVCVERPMKDEILGTVVPEAGKNVRLSGDQALNFVRARHVDGDVTSDYGRITRQQRFLSSLLRKAMSSEVLLDPGKLTDFVAAFSKATFGDNVDVDQLFTLGQSMQGVEAGRVTFITVPTTGYENERHNEDLRVEDTNALFEAIRQDTPLPGETPAKKPADDASKNTAQQSGLKQDQPQGPVDPKSIKIQVLNGGNETGGIAGDTADALAEFGFQIMRVDAAPENIDKTAVIRYSKERTAEAQTLQAAVPGSTLVEDPSMAGAIMLIVGPGFDGEIVSPTGGGKAAEVPENLSTVNAGDVSCA